MPWPRPSSPARWETWLRHTFLLVDGASNATLGTLGELGVGGTEGGAVAWAVNQSEFDILHSYGVVLYELPGEVPTGSGAIWFFVSAQQDPSASTCHRPECRSVGYNVFSMSRCARQHHVAGERLVQRRQG